MKIFIETRKKFLRPSTFERLIREKLGKCRRSKITLGIIDDRLVMAYQTPEGILIAFIGMENIFICKDIAFPEPVRTEQRLILNIGTNGEKAYLVIKPDTPFTEKKRLFIISALLRNSAELNIEYHPAKYPRTWNKIVKDMNQREKSVANYYKDGVPET